MIFKAVDVSFELEAVELESEAVELEILGLELEELEFSAFLLSAISGEEKNRESVKRYCRSRLPVTIAITQVAVNPHNILFPFLLSRSSCSRTFSFVSFDLRRQELRR